MGVGMSKKPRSCVGSGPQLDRCSSKYDGLLPKSHFAGAEPATSTAGSTRFHESLNNDPIPADLWNGSAIEYASTAGKCTIIGLETVGGSPIEEGKKLLKCRLYTLHLFGTMI